MLPVRERTFFVENVAIQRTFTYNGLKSLSYGQHSLRILSYTEDL